MNYLERKDQIVLADHEAQPVLESDFDELYGAGWSDDLDPDAEPLPLNFHTPDEEHL